MAELSEHEILWNTAALTSLRRPQLVSLSKKYGLKANGKNTDLIQRLHDFGGTLTPCSKTLFEQAAVDFPESPTRGAGGADESEDLQLGPSSSRMNALKSEPSRRSLGGRGSDAWEVLTTGDASLVDEAEESEEDPNIRSWKSAGNGKSIGDTNNRYGELRGVGSLRSFATSIKRTASRTLSSSRNGRPAERSSPTVAFPNQNGTSCAAVDAEEELLSGSPASAIGVAKRHVSESSEGSLHHRTSTIRLVSPSPALGMKLACARSSEGDDDELPLTGLNSVERIKERVSMRPLNSSQQHPYPPSAMTRRSMPTLLSPASSGKLYPALPKFDKDGQVVDELSTSEIPGAFPPEPVVPTSPSFVFGSGNKVSTSEFADAGAKLLQEMQAKMGGASFNPELLKGKSAELSKLVSVNSSVGSETGGWGLSAKNTISDRYAAAHQREFSKMRSISNLNVAAQAGSSSAGSSQPAKRKHANTSTEELLQKNVAEPVAEDRTMKRSKTSTGPNYFGTLRGTLTGKRAEELPPRRCSNLRPESVRRFAFLRHKKTASNAAPAASDLAASSNTRTPSSSTSHTDSKSSTLRSKEGQEMVNTSSAQRSLSKPASSTATSQDSLQGAKKRSTRGPIPDFGPMKHTREPLKDESSASKGSLASTQRSKSIGYGSTTGSHRSKSSSYASSTLSRSSKVQNLSRVASTANLKHSATGIPEPRPRQPSLMDTFTGGRPVPTPPVVVRQPSAVSSFSRSASTLLAPTASSLARMQATVKPPSDVTTPLRRPLPQPPKSAGSTPMPFASTSTAPFIPTVPSPFGEVSSRMNFLFDSNFHISPANKSPRPLPQPPVHKSPAKMGSLSMKSPAKTGSLSVSRNRARASGLASIKASGNFDDRAAAQKRYEVRAKQERITQERELRRMLGP